MGVRIDDMTPAASAQPDYEIPAMRSGQAVKLSAGQLATFIVALVTDSAPATLDTLNELAAALGDDPNFATTVANALATKASLTGAETLTNKTITGPIVNGAPSGEFLRGRINGLILSNNATDATNDIDIATGSAGSDGATPVLMTLASGITKRLDAAWAVGSGNGGWLDGASMPDGWGYGFLIRRSDTGVVDVGFSASTSPTLPPGYDQKRLIGFINRASGAIRPFTQNGDDWTWTTPVENLNTNSASTSGALVTVTAPPIANAKANVRFTVSVAASSAQWVRSVNQVNDAVVPLTNSDITTTTNANRAAGFKSIYVNGSGQIRYRSDTSVVNFFIIATEGFTFARGLS